MEFHTDDLTPIGRTRFLTPEGYMVVKDTTIARSGQQIYHATELPELVANADGWISVDRVPEEVFHPAALASLSAKPIVDDHPDGDGEVNPDNWNTLAIGFVSNPRRGTGTNSDAVVADLVLTTRRGIDLVRGGKRALSVGYSANYDQDRPGFAKQRDIRANHVALCDEGRCGPRCAVGDRKPAARPATGTIDAKLIATLRQRDADQRAVLAGINAANRTFWEGR